MVRTLLLLLVALGVAAADGLADAVAAGSAPGGAGGAGRMAVVPTSRRTTAPLDARARRAAGFRTAVDGAVRRGRRLIASITL
jgi:hypothetical protein